jgi:putative hydrolase of the HAD superfamily
LPAFPFDVILFDVGGVLLTNGWDHGDRAAVLGDFHLDIAGFEARHRESYRAWASGGISAGDYLNATVFFKPRDFTSSSFFAAICARSKPMPDGALGILKELFASNEYLLGALNNEPRETNEYRFRHFGLDDLFSVTLSSCYLGLNKPEPAIYRRALEILRRPAERILFIDDRQDNVDGAMAAGMWAIRFEGEAALRRELERLKVLQTGKRS